MWVEGFRRAALEAWGAERASAIERALERTALAVRRLMGIELEVSQAPGGAPRGADRGGDAP